MGKKYRWAVSYTSEFAVDDWGCGDSRAHFSNEKAAKEFAETKKHKAKPFYWQPNMWREVEIETITKRWTVDNNGEKP